MINAIKRVYENYTEICELDKKPTAGSTKIIQKYVSKTRCLQEEVRKLYRNTVRNLCEIYYEEPKRHW